MTEDTENVFFAVSASAPSFSATGSTAVGMVGIPTVFVEKKCKNLISYTGEKPSTSMGDHMKNYVDGEAPSPHPLSLPMPRKTLPCVPHGPSSIATPL